VTVPPQAVLKVIDGDTFRLFTFSYGSGIDIRVQNIDTPERKDPGYEEAKTFTSDWLMQGPFLVHTCGKQSITRIVAIVERNGQTLADALLLSGHQKPAK
jgi:micrococcal nuclease